jgi:hypothetical protein
MGGVRTAFEPQWEKKKNQLDAHNTNDIPLLASAEFTRSSGNLLARPKDPELAENRRPLTGLPD